MENTKYSGLKTEQLLDLTRSAAAPLLSRFSYPWEALEWITPFILELGKSLSEAEYDHPQEDVWISKEAKVAPTAYIHGPAIICLLYTSCIWTFWHSLTTLYVL